MVSVWLSQMTLAGRDLACSADLFSHGLLSALSLEGCWAAVVASAVKAVACLWWHVRRFWIQSLGRSGFV